MEAQTVTARRTGRRVPLRVATLDITVLLGGPSSERKVSLDSGRAVAEALRRLGHRVTAADINPQDLSALDRPGIDVVFIALHGAFGENGQVQRLCAQRKLAYVGSGPEASETAMDKVASKQAFRRAGLATPDWAVIDRAMPAARAAALLAECPPPCVVKPVDGGSSVDITIARDMASRDAAVAALVAKYGRALAEKYVRGRELTVGILGDQALPVIEIRTSREFYDYRAKYEDDTTQYLVDPALPAGAAERMRADALTAHACLGCRDFSRVDFILDESGVPQVLEVNTIPGFTSHSLLPKGAEAAGITFDQLCGRMVQMALARAGR